LGLLFLALALASLPLYAQEATLSVPLHSRYTYNPAGPLFTLQHTVGATGNLQEWKNPAGAVVLYVDVNGALNGPANGFSLWQPAAAVYDGVTLTKTQTVPVPVGNDAIAVFIENNKQNNDAAQVTQTGIEAVSRSRGAGAETTLRGGHFRTYIDDTTGGTAITSVGVDGAVRASGAVAADPGTAFVGVRSYMSPGFTGPTLANVTNFHAFWAYNESATQAVTNVLYASAAAGGFTNGFNFSGTTIATADGVLSSGAMLCTGSAATRAAARAVCTGAIGSLYLSTAGNHHYLKIANAGNDQDWQLITSSNAD
jgi:hypothetical protein